MLSQNQREAKAASQSFPSIFVSHGAPTLAVGENLTTDFLRRLGAELVKPRVVLCVSAHWNACAPEVSAAEWPRTIRDFGGFAEELYRITYPRAGRSRARREGRTLGGLVMCACDFDAVGY